MQRVYLDDQLIAENEGPINLSRPVKADDAVYVVIALSSEGLACPADLMVLELHQGAHRTSAPFGTCSELFEAMVDEEGRLRILVPLYAAHPDFVEPDELERSAHTLVEYTWSHGAMSEREVRHSLP